MACLFCEFASGKRKFHEWKKKYPLMPIFEDNDVYSFLSVPDNNKETHLLIIPKKHYEFFEEIPENELKTLILKVQFAVKKIRKEYDSCHLLLNNGKNAEQYAPHIHFHIIPKNKEKQIPWINLTPEKFKKISKNLKESFKKQDLKTLKTL